MGAVRSIPGITELGPNDDGSTAFIPWGFTWMGFDGCWVENNGWVGLSALGSGYYPHYGISGNYQPTRSDFANVGPAPESSPGYKLAPYWFDVDTRAGGGLPTPATTELTYGIAPSGLASGYFVVNWFDVGVYNRRYHPDLLSKFQLIIGPTGFEFNFDYVGADMGEASGTYLFSDVDGSAVLNAEEDWYPALSGFYLPESPHPDVDALYYVQDSYIGSRLDGSTPTPGSLLHDQLVDGGPRALVESSFNSSVLGRYNFGLYFAEPNLDGYLDSQSQVFDS